MKSKNKLNFAHGQFGQLANTVRYGAQLVPVEIEPIQESDENRNQMTNQIPYLVRFTSEPMQSGTELSWLLLSQSLLRRGERSPENLLIRNPHCAHSRASCDCKAVSRSFPYSFHLSPRQSKIDMLSVRDLQRSRKETLSASHLKL